MSDADLEWRYLNNAEFHASVEVYHQVTRAGLGRIDATELREVAELLESWRYIWSERGRGWIASAVAERLMRHGNTPSPKAEPPTVESLTPEPPMG